ncbi:unconventional myosin-VI-like isoform X2 [Oppia nitens]|uniref:unconventional myosin-VI-like isoform X2 n=1 Tax=Oppia nitens TaxID=1686743 RepID=UPI0023DC73AD|nr:unconventional myosin-VI-like isoform X2 [Oppia nitens]
MESQKVWVNDVNEGYVLGNIVDIGPNGPTVQTSNNKQIQATYDGVFPAEEDDNKEVEDNCALMFLNEATLLNNIRLRYKKDKIYTYVANILIAVNPYFEVKDLYSSNTLKSYQGKSLGTMSPHVFAIADKAFRDMRATKQSQSIVVSGESGAGKTESTKYVLRYLCESWGSQSGQIEQLILDANPVLEAFGNAKTMRNNNSSRFGKFIEIHFNAKHTVVGGYISHYLLEKSRICGQSVSERNYHIFYQLCAGLPAPAFAKLKLSSPDKFHYLNRGCTQFFSGKQSDGQLNADRKSAQHQNYGPLKDPIVDDIKDFKAMDSALNHFGVSDVQRMAIYQTVAAVLHLGNIVFEESNDDSKGGCRVAAQSRPSLETVAELIGVDCDQLQQSLLSRVMQTPGGGSKGTIYMVPLKVYEAQNARDALAKAIYSKIFDFIVKTINKSIPFSTSAHYIGVLDIAGFEYFENNSFEQFCINYCNEKLQQFFNERILKEEQTLYEREGLGLKKIEFIDNQDCIDLLEGKSSGIFDLLDEESKLPKPSTVHFTETVHKTNGTHFRLAVPRKSKLRSHREIRDDEGFLIRHFAGAVCYETQAFIDKNNDALHASLEALMVEANNPLLKQLFTVDDKNSKNANNNFSLINNNFSSKTKTANKLAFVSVGGKFRSQLLELMSKLRSTGTHFIRCIKPNPNMVAHQFEGTQIMSQLRCSGMTSVLELMQMGYPSRAAFADLYAMYSKFLPPELARLDPRLFCRALFKALGLNETDFRFGATKIFFRPGKFAEFDQIMKSDSDHLAQLIEKVQKWLLQSRWKKTQWCCLSVIKLKNKIQYRRQQIIIIQKNIRMMNALNKYRPRYKGLIKVKQLKSHLLQIHELSKHLTSNSDKEMFDKLLKKVDSDMSQLMNKLRNDNKINSKEIDREIQQMNESINGNISQLKGKLAEQERLLKIQKQMEIERKQREEEERKVNELEENKRKKAEMEEKARLEAIAVAEREAKAAKEELEKQIKNQSLLETELKRIEQEKRDYELAARLAQDSESTISDDWQSSPTMLPRSAAVIEQRQSAANKKYKLEKWKYSDLRDTINTSCDIELLEACREEFHRRLKVYHSWKSRANRNKTTNGEQQQRAPNSILDHNSNISIKGINDGSQRYFRLPFNKPNTPNGHKGWWFAHFDGQWIARQMEIHPEKQPILLIAGRDDMQMCELSLEETRLTSKRGAQILEQEFENEWIRNGGKPYVRGQNDHNLIQL